MKVSRNEKEYYHSSSDESSSDDSSSDESSSDESSSDESSSDESSSNASSSMNLLPVGNTFIRQNSKNGYVSVNDITKGTGKYWSGYKDKKRTKQFIKELEITTKIPKKHLITGKSNQDRWIHPYIAIHFCQWICPKISVEISRFVYNFISGSFVPSEFTQYIKTISDNKQLIKSKKRFESDNEKLKKELNELRSNKSSFEQANEKLKRKLKSFKNITIHKNQLKIKNSKEYDMSIIENDTLVLTPK